MTSNRFTRNKRLHRTPPVCKAPPPPYPPPYPYPDHPMDILTIPGARLLATPTALPRGDAIPVLHIIPQPNFQWIRARSQHALGPAFNVRTALAHNLNGLAVRLIASSVRMVTNHAFAASATQIIKAAIACPQIQFLNVVHSNTNHMIHWPKFNDELGQLLHQTRILTNLHVATPDVNSTWNETGYPRAFLWPNPIMLPLDPKPNTPKRPAIAIIGRADWAKAMPAQLAAARIVQNERNVKVFLTLHPSQPDHPAIIRTTQTLGLKVSRQPWMELGTLWHWLHANISVLLQPSFAETFNYLTVDAAAVHVPFVGSYAIQHCPPAWQVRDPNNAHEIAATALRILANLRVQKTIARPLAEAVAKRNNALYLWEHQRILNLPRANRPPAALSHLPTMVAEAL